MKTFSDVSKKLETLPTDDAKSTFLSHIYRRIVRIEKFLRGNSHVLKVRKGNVVVEAEHTTYTMDDILNLLPTDVRREFESTMLKNATQLLNDAVLGYTTAIANQVTEVENEDTSKDD